MLFKTIISTVAALSAGALGHMQLTTPCPRYSPACATSSQLPPGESFDYDLNGPIGSEGNALQLFCKHTTPWTNTTNVWTPGQSVTIDFAPGGATHSGGHCQFSLSYDGGKSFVVIYEVLRYCFYTAPPSSSGTPSVRSYTFDLPAGLPGADSAVFAWTWVNAEGNREYYNNCGDVSINAGAGSFTGKQITVANYGSGSPIIPEFLGDYDTGIEYYENVPSITVTGSGYTGGRKSSA